MTFENSVFSGALVGLNTFELFDENQLYEEFKHTLIEKFVLQQSLTRNGLKKN